MIQKFILSASSVFLTRVHFRAANFMIRLLTLVKKSEWQNLSVPKMFTQTVKRFPQKVMFYFEDETWTFQEVEDYSNQVANYFLSKGYSKGDSIALFMENRPEYVATWLGLAKIGVIPALINYNLKDKALTHTVQVAKCTGYDYVCFLNSKITYLEYS